MSEAVLEVRNLVKYFGRRKVIDNVSFKVLPGEIFGFLGPNGAGKTTTIKMIMGFLGVDEGEILINGVTLRKDYEKAMSCIGGIVENPEMYKDLSGQLNLEMYARLHEGVTKERIREVVELVGMQNRINDKVKKYSLGMKQRVGLAQSILHRPKILILDEPTNGLDPSGIKELRDIFKKLAHEEGVAVFVSSHLLSEMQLMCDRVGIISNGRLIDVKPILQLMQDAAGGVFYRFATKQSDQASSLLDEKYGGRIRNATGNYFELEIEENSVPEVIRMLTLGGVALYGVQRVESSLEDAFISMTGGGNSIA
jgi:ABC-2 type transport system ATP-binding protein